jgi:hypothetical protein
MLGKSWIVLGLAAAIAGCGREEKSELEPLVGVGGNAYCVSDADEARLASQAVSDPMATWILIHHYQRCEVDTNKAATLLSMQMKRGDKVMMDTLAQFNERIALGQTMKAPAQKAN